MTRISTASIIPLALILAISTPFTAAAESDDAITLTATTPFSGWFRSGAFLPVDITVSTASNPIDARLTVPSDTMMLHRSISMPAPSQRTFRFMLAPHYSLPVEARLVSGGRILASAEIDTLREVPPDAALALLAGAPPAAFTTLADALPEGSQIAAVTMDSLPDDARAFDCVDLLILADLASKPAEQQTLAIRQWLSGGGRMLVMLPPDGMAPAATFWRSFLPIGRFPAGTPLREAARELQRTGLDVSVDDARDNIMSFRFGMGRVTIAAPENAGQNQLMPAGLAAAAVEMLQLQDAHRDAAPLLARGIYELFEPLEWSAAVRMRIWLAALGYALAMSVVLKVFHRERAPVFAASIAGFAVLFAAILYFGLLPRSNVALQRVSVARTRAGGQALDVAQYLNARAPEDESFSLKFEDPVKPLFFSERMLAQGQVSGSVDDGSVKLEIPARIGRVSCFRQQTVRFVQGKLDIEKIDNCTWRITNAMKNAGTGKPVALSGVVFTDGHEAVFIGELPPQQPLDVNFSPDARRRLGGVIHDNFARQEPFRERMFQHWASQPASHTGIHLLGWSDQPMMQQPAGKFLLNENHGTFWEIRLE